MEWMSVSAFKDRGLIEHLNGIGWLCLINIENERGREEILLPDSPRAVLDTWLDDLPILNGFRDIECRKRHYHGHEQCLVGKMHACKNISSVLKLPRRDSVSDTRTNTGNKIVNKCKLHSTL